MARIVVCGYMVRFPVPGNMFAFFHYVAGLEKLGHQVVYIEESGWNNACFDPVARRYSNDPTAGLVATEAMFKRFGVEDLKYAFVDRFRGEAYGSAAEDVEETIRDADVVLNIGGVCWFDAFDKARRLVLIDTDPLFTQVGKFGYDHLPSYHSLFSYGGNIGREGCTVPTLGLQWNGVFPPVVPEFWATHANGSQSGAQPVQSSLTTIANWTAYGEVVYEGETYGQKNVEFERFINLPAHVEVPLELATDNMPDSDRWRFIDHGWKLESGVRVSATIESYMDYIQRSQGEFSVAKNAYVKSRCGWVSDRTVCYLAASHPAIVQETGICDLLPVGEGLLTFSSLEEAAATVDRIQRDPDRHAEAARQLAHEYFDYRAVLPRLLD